MQCIECGKTLAETVERCPACHASVADDLPERPSWLAAVERFLAAHLTPARAKAILALAAGVILLSALLSWHPWQRPRKVSPITYPIPGETRDRPGATWTPGTR